MNRAERIADRVEFVVPDELEERSVILVAAGLRQDVDLRRLVAELVRGNALFTVAENARLGLVGLLARRGAAFESLGVNAERLFARIARAPDGLFR